MWSAESPRKIPHLKSSFSKSQGESDSKYFWNPQHSRPSAINYFCKDRKGSVIDSCYTCFWHQEMDGDFYSKMNQPLDVMGPWRIIIKAITTQCPSVSPGQKGYTGFTGGCMGFLNSLLYHPAEGHAGPIYLKVICLPFHIRKGLPREDGINFQDSIDKINTVSWFFFFADTVALKEIKPEKLNFKGAVTAEVKNKHSLPICQIQARHRNQHQNL